MHSAGVTDSALTNHGVLQAQRLGKHLKGLTATRIFTSDLQRAVRTAEEVRAATLSEVNQTVSDRLQGNSATSLTTRDTVRSKKIKIQQCAELREQDFGYYEGKPFYARPNPKSRMSGKDAHRLVHRKEPGFVDVESRESMDARCNSFVETHLDPLLKEVAERRKDGGEVVEENKEEGKEEDRKRDGAVIIAAHGIILGHLWRAILARIPRGNITVSVSAQAALEGRGLEHLAGWSNTGYLEVEIERAGSSGQDDGRRETNVPSAGTGAADRDVVGSGRAASPAVKEENELKRRRSPGSERPEDQTMPPEIDVDSSGHLQASSPIQTPNDASSTLSEFGQARKSKVIEGLKMRIIAVNSTAHLAGLKKTKGGIGSAKFDEGQKTIESFFKKRKTK